MPKRAPPRSTRSAGSGWVYFVADNENPHYDNLRIKIGFSTTDVRERLRAFQTGSPQELKLMGWIESNNVRELEAELHRKYRDRRAHLEWFNLSVSNVYNELRAHSVQAWIPVDGDSFEIVMHDSDGIPEFVGAWQWMDVDHQDFCPRCGWGGGLSYNENYGGDRCLKCGFIG